MHKEAKRSHHELSDLPSHVQDAIDPGVAALTDGVTQIRKSLADVLVVGKDTLAIVRDRAIIRAKAVDKTIKDNPYPAIGIAFGLGMLLTYLIKRK
jgi:ElaB/YqjD/DUF883 family membrane-anchored ribosome-binding protein